MRIVHDTHARQAMPANGKPVWGVSTRYLHGKGA